MFIYADGSTYTGDFKEGKKDGKGIYLGVVDF